MAIANKNASGGSEANRITITSYPGEIAKLKGAIHDRRVGQLHHGLEARARDAHGDGHEPQDRRATRSCSPTTTCRGREPRPASGWVPRRPRRPTGRRSAATGSTTAPTASRAARRLDLLVEHNLIYDNTGWGARLQPNVEGDRDLLQRLRRQRRRPSVRRRRIARPRPARSSTTTSSPTRARAAGTSARAGIRPTSRRPTRASSRGSAHTTRTGRARPGSTMPPAASCRSPRS